MLSFDMKPVRLCEGVTRREWLRAGGLSSMGLMLPDLLRAEQSRFSRVGNPQNPGFGPRGVRAPAPTT